MPQIGPLEILVVGVFALIVFGPERLPEIGRSLGKGLHQMKKMASDVKSEFDMSLAEEKPVTKPTAATDVDAVVLPDDSVQTPRADGSVASI
jgi:sec-independent protein translocase protein TatA